MISNVTFGQFQKVYTVNNNNNVYALAANNQFIFAGTGGSGMFRSSDNGDTWNLICNGIPPWYYFSLLSTNDTLFAGSFGVVNCSFDNGTTWTDLNLGLTLNDFVYSLARKGQYLYAGIIFKGVYSHQIGGTSWNVCNAGLHHAPTINDLLVIGPDIYAATDSGVYKSTNDAASWNRISNGIPNSLAVNKLFFDVTNNLLFAGTSENIYQTSDLGATWTLSGNGIPVNSNIRCFGSLNDTLFTGSYTDLFASADIGNDWFPFDNGLPPGTGAISMTSNANTLFAGNGGGIYRYPAGSPVNIVNYICQDKFKIYTCPGSLSEYLVIEIPEDLKESMVYIYNLQGQEMMKLTLDKTKTMIDIRSFSKGIYLVRLSTHDQDQTKKIIKT
jgi:photosystem II stability/assembly factor-like uncharacterized protein